MTIPQPQTQNSRHQHFTALKMMKYKFYAEPVLVILLAHCTLHTAGLWLYSVYDGLRQGGHCHSKSMRWDCNNNIIIIFIFRIPAGNMFDHRYYRLRKRDWKLLTWAIERVRALRVIVCILGYPRFYDNLTKEWPKMATAVYLSTDNSITKVVSSLKKAYPSEGVSTLNVAGKVESLTPPCSMLQIDKVREAKSADFWPFSRPARSQKPAHPPRSAYLSVPIQWLWPCDPFVAVALSRLKVKSYKAFPRCSLSP